MSPVLSEKWRLGEGTISDSLKSGADLELEFMPPVLLLGKSYLQKKFDGKLSHALNSII